MSIARYKRKRGNTEPESGRTSRSYAASPDHAQPNGSTVRATIIADIQRYVSYGIDGGFTDYPELWKQAVAPHGKEQQANDWRLERTHCNEC